MYLPASHRARRRSRIGRKSRRQLCLYTVIGHARSRDSSVIPRVGGALSPGRGESPLSSPVSRSGFSHESRPHIQDTHRSSNPVKEPLWFVQRSTTESTRPGVSETYALDVPAHPCGQTNLLHDSPGDSRCAYPGKQALTLARAAVSAGTADNCTTSGS